MSKTLDLGPITAYAIAVKNGFVGTEQEWLESLKSSSVTDEQIGHAVDAYLESHPDATVPDGSITEAKLAQDVTDKLSKLSEEKVNLPKDDSGAVQNGTDGQILRTNGDGTTQWVDKPNGGTALTVTNTASVGQTVKITAVDENGQPAEWEAVDMESGGGSGNWKQAGFVQSETDGETLEVSGLDTKSIRLVVCAAAYASDTNNKAAAIKINGAISLNYAGFIQLTDIKVAVIEIHLLTTPSGNYIFAPNFPTMRTTDNTATSASSQNGSYSAWFLVRADTVEKIESISFACGNGTLLTGSKLNVEVI